jgi:membrane-associated tyrosine/threonine-specific cdc2-inhibitory kinase
VTSISTGGRLAAKVILSQSRAELEFTNRREIPENPFLVHTVDLYKGTTKSLLLMDECEGGDISYAHFTEQVAWQLLNNVAVGLLEIHSQGWIHLDISPGNILRNYGLFKIADFGTLKRIGEFHEGDEGAGPYVSPEALEFPHGEAAVTSQTDIFSFGVVMMEVISGKKAPRGGSIGYGRLRAGTICLGAPAYPCEASQDLINLVNAMMARNPSDRPTAADIVQLTTDG